MRFFEENKDEGVVRWEKYGIFGQQDVHRQVSYISNYAFSTGSVYGFGKKKPKQKGRTPTISESTSKIMFCI